MYIPYMLIEQRKYIIVENTFSIKGKANLEN